MHTIHRCPLRGSPNGRPLVTVAAPCSGAGRPGRQLRRVVLWVAALLVCSQAPSLSGQTSSTPARPLDAGHWAYDFMEVVHALGAPGVWSPWTEPLVAPAVGSALQEARRARPDLGAPLDRWIALFETETGLPAGQWGRLGMGAGFQGGSASLLPERGGFVDGLVDIPLSPQVALWAEGGVSSETSEADLVSGGLAARFGAAQLVAGRMRARIGQGTSRILLAGRSSMDGVLVGSARPFLLPGFLKVFGRVTAHILVSPNVSTPTTDRAWFSSMGMSIEPHPAVQLGAYRTVRFAGEGISDPSVGEIFQVLSGQGGSEDFDDSQGELAARVRFRAWGQAVAPYLSVGFEDLPSLWEDPGLVAGVLVPVETGSGIVAARYEYQAFGKQAQWCLECEYKSHRWYTQRSYGEYTFDDVLLASSLGGYGTRHLVEASWWGALPLRLSGMVFFEEREEGNLLFERWPGQRQGVGASAAARPRPGWEVEAGSVLSWSGGSTEGQLSLVVRIYDVFSNPAGVAR